MLQGDLQNLKRLKVNAALDGLSFSCGSPSQDLDLEDNILSEIYVQDLHCGDPVEPLYYSANFQDICVYCCEDIQENLTSKEYYPQCQDCKHKEHIAKKQNK